MEPRKRAIILLITLLLSTQTVSAGPAESVEAGVVFGGQSTEANITSTNLNNLSDLPTIVEVYTATWCSNCVDVEHALDDVEANASMHQYHIHRSISEMQDPFGTDVLDGRFHDRYGRYSPPAVVFNGTTMVRGSVSQSDSLQEDFSTIVDQPLELGVGSSSFVWTPTGDSQGTVAWALDVNTSQFGEGTLGAYLWVVEHSAYYKEGTNGLENYPHIVRDMIHLGNESQGTVDVMLPAAFDDSDLSVHLVYQFTPQIEEVPLEDVDASEDDALPFLPSLATLSMIGVAAALRRPDYG